MNRVAYIYIRAIDLPLILIILLIKLNTSKIARKP